MIITNVTGHHMEVTRGIENHLDEKVKLLKKHFDNLKIDFILKTEKSKSHIQATTRFLGRNFSVGETNKDMYKAITLLIKKLNRIIRKEKEKVQTH
jgi:putative sigma-54 modulation protein